MIDNGLTPAEQARTGTYSDQFLEGVDWGGTFKGSWTDPTEINAQRDRLTVFNHTHPFRGESNFGPNAWAPTHLGDFLTFGVGTLRDIQGWTSGLTQAQRDEITRRLGYRIRLDQATLPATVSVGRPITVTLRIDNEGYAAPRRMRPAILSFGGAKVATTWDVRTWQPGVRTVTTTVLVPAGATSGALTLAFPDPTISTDPRYAIRLANAGVWDAANGTNRLGTAVV